VCGGGWKRREGKMTVAETGFAKEVVGKGAEREA